MIHSSFYQLPGIGELAALWCQDKKGFFLFALQKQKKKNKPEVFNFSAIHLIHDPQGGHTSPLIFFEVRCQS